MLVRFPSDISLNDGNAVLIGLIDAYGNLALAIDQSRSIESRCLSSSHGINIRRFGALIGRKSTAPLLFVQRCSQVLIPFLLPNTTKRMRHLSINITVAFFLSTVLRPSTATLTYQGNFLCKYRATNPCLLHDINIHTH